MNVLRWLLIFITAVTGMGWILLFTWAEGFRKSFGASANSPLVMIVPLAVFGFLLLVFLWPRPWLLYGLAAVAAAGILGCLWIASEAPVLCAFGLAYCLGILIFFWGNLPR